MLKYRYFLKASWQEEWTEVTEEEFIRAERSAGFRPKTGCGGVAIRGFCSGDVSGKIEVVTTTECSECKIREGDYIKERSVILCSLHEAASDLLGACRKALEDLETWHGEAHSGIHRTQGHQVFYQCESCETCQVTIPLLRAAIAKATGQDEQQDYATDETLAAQRMNFQP